MEQSPAALETNDADDTRIGRDQVPPLGQPSTANPRRIRYNAPKVVPVGQAVPLEHLGRKEIREFLDWVHEDVRQDIE